MKRRRHARKHSNYAAGNAMRPLPCRLRSVPVLQSYAAVAQVVPINDALRSPSGLQTRWVLGFDSRVYA